MIAHASTQKPYKGRGMNGAVAKWYAAHTRKRLEQFKEIARRIAAQIQSGNSVLEVAPGLGYLAIELGKLGKYDITGLDISETFVQIARDNAAKAGVSVDFRLGNASQMPFADNAFDFLVCTAAFKNFTEPVRALQEMHRVLRPGGQVLIVDLRRDAPQAAIDKAVNDMHLGVVNTTLIKLTFRFMLLKRAYTKATFERMLAQTDFRSLQIKEDLIALEVSAAKGPVPAPVDPLLA